MLVLQKIGHNAA